MKQTQQAPNFQKKPSQLEETLQNFIKATHIGLEHINKKHEEMGRNQDETIKNMEMMIGQLSRQISALYSTSGGLTVNTVNNSKNKTCKVVDAVSKVLIEQGNKKTVQGGVTEREEKRNLGDEEEIGVTLD